ncbi:MAG TPA: hypothetical protein IGS17_06610 [Oscillatoriales cyanobacterium M59_W2019_021]|nr:hypothetical protein [Oscillatoriales cyanobacterium M4454_W2019_049]HIK50584.1 hypothetical protein [Oscillatoriales cyanobacterium M59_W2019_021]
MFTHYPFANKIGDRPTPALPYEEGVRNPKVRHDFRGQTSAIGQSLALPPSLQLLTSF